MALQLELGIKPIIQYSFDNYVVCEHNTQAISHLKYLIKHPENSYFYLWGCSNVGKSHLLHAVIEQASSNNLTAAYFNFQNIVHPSEGMNLLRPEVFDSLELFDIVCLDDVQVVAGNNLWEEELFGFYNRIKDANKILIITSNSSVNCLNINLKDLKSRLASGVSYNIKPLSDHDKIVLLQNNAYQRGITITNELAQFLIFRSNRDIPALFKMLDLLDQASLRYKRKLTIPFAKEILGF